MSTKPKWQFPPRNGGIDFVQDPSSTHFSDDPIPKLVREIIQNSLDARESGISDPVVVKFADTEVKRELIGASQLCKHLNACLERAKREKMPPGIRKVYENARNALKIPRIRCLRITDSGTTGLSDSKWDALVVREGDVRKSNAGAPGGSYGIGKNAVFNVSDAQTVFYSTRYVNGKEGRVEKMQGKATLMAHQDPATGKYLQHIGFYRASNGDPFITKYIPPFFRLEEPGTGVFVMGFNPLSSDWVDAVTSAVIENFFYAIHHKQLIVEISAGSKNVRVTHETIDQLFEARSSRKPNAYHYYLAIRDEEAEQTAEKIDKVGKLDVYLAIGSGLPNRVAYVNRNGMLITDSKEQRYNPMAPRRNGLWPDYAAVVLPSTDEGDKWVRGMENPSHDSVSSEQLLEINARREAGRVFKEVRDAIRRIIDKKVQLDQYGDRSNLYELAEMFPEDFDPSAQGNRELPVEEVVPRFITSSPPGPEPGPGPGPGPGLGPEPGPGPGPGHSPGPGPGPNPPPPGPSPSPRQTRPPRLDNPRFIPVGQREAVIAFAMSEGAQQDKVRVALTPTGGEYYRESEIEVVEATVLNPGEHDLSIENGVVSVTPKPDERLAIRVTTKDRIDNLAFKIG